MDILERVKDIYQLAANEVSNVIDRLERCEHMIIGMSYDDQMRLREDLRRSTEAVTELWEWLDKHQI